MIYYTTTEMINKSPEIMGMVVNKAIEIFKEEKCLIDFSRCMLIAFGKVNQDVYDSFTQLKYYHGLRIDLASGFDGDAEYHR